jgi:TetR/AcrR family transcriptional repressor of nem operon
MKISEEQRVLNRQKIVDTAARLFRLKGFDGVGIADIMKEAGFTHGGFYNHFKSKDELVAAALSSAFDKLEKETRGKDITAIINRYLSHNHRDDLTESCPASSLGGDTARQAVLAKEAFAEGIETWFSMISEALNNEATPSSSEHRNAIIGYFAKLVGAIILARSCPPDSKLRNEILNASKLSLTEEITLRLKKR